MFRKIVLISSLGVLLASIYMQLTCCLGRRTSSNNMIQKQSIKGVKGCQKLGPMLLDNDMAPLKISYDLHQPQKCHTVHGPLRARKTRMGLCPGWSPNYLWPKPHKMAWLTEISEKSINITNFIPSKSGTLPGREAKDWMDMHLNYSLLILDSQAVGPAFTKVPWIKRDQEYQGTPVSSSHKLHLWIKLCGREKQLLVQNVTLPKLKKCSFHAE